MTQDNHDKERDPVTGIETTGHEWDGLRELNIPAPRWWLWVFFATFIFSIGYWIVYPAWPTLVGATKGVWAWTQFTELKEQQAEVAAQQAQYVTRFDQASLGQISADKELYEFARVGGAVAFRDNCAACHGTGAAGGKGYPNLNDDDWLWGGSLDEIYATIRYGIRAGHEKGHEGTMAAWKDVLKAGDIDHVADYVMHLRDGDAAPKGIAYESGKKIFAENCTVCHGNNGEGNSSVGAPILNDAIWLYGGSKAAIVATIMGGRAGVMPVWEWRLDDRTIKELAIYVHSLGGGK